MSMTYGSIISMGVGSVMMYSLAPKVHMAWDVIASVLMITGAVGVVVGGVFA